MLICVVFTGGSKFFFSHPFVYLKLTIKLLMLLFNLISCIFLNFCTLHIHERVLYYFLYPADNSLKIFHTTRFYGFL